MNHNERYYPNFITVPRKEGLGVAVVKYFQSEIFSQWVAVDG